VVCIVVKPVVGGLAAAEVGALETGTPQHEVVLDEVPRIEHVRAEHRRVSRHVAHRHVEISVPYIALLPKSKLYQTKKNRKLKSLSNCIKSISA
jgi:hypothetical protein